MSGRIRTHLSWRLDDLARRRLKQQSSTGGTPFAANYAERVDLDSREPPKPGDLEAYFDGNLQGPGLWKWRHYFPIYERHLARFRGEKPDLVEIGVYSGGSLGMWHAYFDSGATVYGIDIEPACTTYEAPDTHVFIGDQADPAFWTAFLAKVPAFDIVIDDGGHEAHQQIATLEAVLPRLRPGGVYLCEDIHGERNPLHTYLADIARELHVMTDSADPYVREPNAWQRSIDSIHLYPFVAVIEKRASPLEVLEAPKHGTQWQPFYD